jgi:UDP-N-acetylmuramate dehydrogenase
MRIFTEFDLKSYNSYRLNARCAKAFFPETVFEILQIYQENPRITKILIGNGNNIILSREWYDDYFIIFNGNFNEVEVKGNEIVAEAGATMLQLSEMALQNSLSGFEIFYDIPSSVGGAVVMNAGASGEEIKDLLIKVRYLDLKDMKVKERANKDIGFEYRNSYFQQNPSNIVLKVWFKLKPGNPTNIKGKMDATKMDRWAKQPREYPNCGSVFKRPLGKYVGPMLDELRLKGLTVGGAQISRKHSGFIINLGSATGEDILNIIHEVQDKVYETFGITLEVEQRIL